MPEGKTIPILLKDLVERKNIKMTAKTNTKGHFIAKKSLAAISYKRKIYLLLLIMLIYLSTSCVTQRYVEYMQDSNTDVKKFVEAEFPDYELKPNDELFIQIKSLDEGPASIFINTGNQTSGTSSSLSPFSASLLSYSIDKEGYLFLPLLGNVFVRGKTLSEVSLILRDSLTNVLSQPVVSVKLVNRYISVLGEVRNPGHFPYSQERLTVYDALGLAGDITDYGNRQNVILVRNENGENMRINLKLTKSEVLASDFYYMRPNDIVYVKPLSNKFWGMRQFPFPVLFSTLTTALLIYNIFR